VTKCLNISETLGYFGIRLRQTYSSVLFSDIRFIGISVRAGCLYVTIFL